MLIDTHCHLYFEDFDNDRIEVLERMSAAGIKGAILPALDKLTAEQARGLCATHHQLRYAAGWHPGYALPPQFMKDGCFDAESMLAPFRTAAPPPIAIGEIGLDGREGVNPMPLQKELLLAQLVYACQWDLPVIMHLRDAETEMLEVLSRAPIGLRGVFHCFDGSPAVLEYAVHEGWFLSFAGNVTFPKAQQLRDAATRVPMELLLVETDAPFLAPQAVRGKRCEPAYTAHTARYLAQLRQMDFDACCRQLTANAQRCFGTAWN